MTTCCLPDNAQKVRIWRAYHDRRPLRVPMRLNTNPRIILLDPALNPDGWSFEDAAKDPKIHVMTSLLWQRHLRLTLHRYTDGPTGLPEVWPVSLHTYNVYEAASLGAPVRYMAGQLPATEPLEPDALPSLFDIDIARPLMLPFVREQLAFWLEMEKVCRDLHFEGRPVRLLPWAPTGTDGPVTVACNLRGIDFLSDLVEDPDYAGRLMELVVRAAIARRAAMWNYWGEGNRAGGRANHAADDSSAILSPELFASRVLPHLRRFYDAGPAAAPRLLHLCGKASHLFPLLRRELTIDSFDTGFPIDHGRVRRQLGPDVEISGGPEIDLLLSATPERVYQRTREILTSGVTHGGRFILQEGNNLPPRVPLANIEAMYQSCLEYGAYPGSGEAF